MRVTGNPKLQNARGGKGRFNPTNNVAKTVLELVTSIPCEKLRTWHGQGYFGAPLTTENSHIVGGALPPLLVLGLLKLAGVNRPSLPLACSSGQHILMISYDAPAGTVAGATPQPPLFGYWRNSVLRSVLQQSH